MRVEPHPPSAHLIPQGRSDQTRDQIAVKKEAIDRALDERLTALANRRDELIASADLDADRIARIESKYQSKVDRAYAKHDRLTARIDDVIANVKKTIGERHNGRTSPGNDTLDVTA